MKHAILLTGAPGVGKTTIIQQAIIKIKKKAGGFYTREIRDKGERKGFEIVTLDGKRAVLSHTDIKSPYRVSKYGIDIANFDNIGVLSLRQAIQDCDIICIDEIGKMELYSFIFREAVMDALDSGKKIVGTIMLAPDEWANQIKEDPRVEVKPVYRTNRQQILQELITWLNSD